MTREGEHNEGVSIGALLRLAADGELTPEQEERLAAHLAAHPEDAARIEFDRELKAACARACCPGCCAPESLRERVIAECCDEAPVGVVAAGVTRERSFWSRRTALRWSAAAAALVVVGLGAFMLGRAPAGPPEPSFGSQLARFARNEHGRCSVEQSVLKGKFTIGSPEQVPGEFAKLVNREVNLGSILEAEEHGLHFVDAGRCRPPGGVALHVRFTTGEIDDPTGYVSLWVQLDDGSAGFAEDRTYCGGTGCDKVSVWVRDGVRYVLICSQTRDDRPAQEALGAPSTLAGL